MDFSQYAESQIIDMTVHDLPPDATLFILRGDRPTSCIGASSRAANRHWEYRHESSQGGYVWHIWGGTSDYYAMNGDAISHDRAADLIWKTCKMAYVQAHPELQLPAGL